MEVPSELESAKSPGAERPAQRFNFTANGANIGCHVVSNYNRIRQEHREVRPS